MNKDKTDDEVMAEIEKALEACGVESWMLFAYCPPTKLVYSRSKNTVGCTRCLLKQLTEDPQLRHTFKSMVMLIESGFASEPIPGGKA
jgi:hypothetical protein